MLEINKMRDSMTKKTVMILGAGVPRAVASEQNLPVKPPLDADFFDIAYKHFPYAYQSIRRFLKKKVGSHSCTLVQSLEKCVTYLHFKSTNAPLKRPYQNKLDALLHLFRQVLKDSTNRIETGEDTLIDDFLWCEVNRLDYPSDLTIITFNYDLLIENALEAISYDHPEAFNFPACYRFEIGATKLLRERLAHPFMATGWDGYGARSKGVGLLKLHGSINWQITSDTHTPPESPEAQQKKLYILNARKMPPGLLRAEQRNGFYMHSVIVPPIYGKWEMMHKTLAGLWKEAAQKVRDADRVIIAGYSCPTADIEAQILLAENMHMDSQKKLYVIDKDQQTADRIVDLCGVERSATYTSIQRWLSQQR